jgi:hypothetical protein
VKSVTADESEISDDTPLVVGSRTYKVTKITLPDNLKGKVSAVNIVTVDPASYTGGHITSPIVGITIYGLNGEVV